MPKYLVSANTPGRPLRESKMPGNRFLRQNLMIKYIVKISKKSVNQITNYLKF